ncbi:MAG: hypothetical protein JNL58_19150 [Planctomyces sp.]|nr:hypothetical protein [Planctomyces sp.]
MKRSMRLSSLLAFTILTTGAVAQEEQRGAGERPRLQGMREQGGRPDMGALMARMPLMAALDTDGNGELSAPELENASKSLATLDKDGNGVLSPEELRPDFAAMGRDGQNGPGRPGRPGQPGQPGPGGPGGPMMSKDMMLQMFKRQDADGDGMLSGDEIPERMKQMVSRLDSDGDGSISEKEMSEAAARFEERGGLRGVRGENEGKDGSGVRPKRPPVE